MPYRVNVGSVADAAVHGTVDLYSDVTIGTVSVSNLGTVQNIVAVGTVDTVSTVTAMQGSVLVTGASNVQGSVLVTGASNLQGSVFVTNIVNSKGTIATVQSGSVGLLGGSTNIVGFDTAALLPQVGTLGLVLHVGTVGEVTSMQGSVLVTGATNVQGSVLVTGMQGSVLVTGVTNSQGSVLVTGILGGTVGQINNVGSITTLTSVTSVTDVIGLGTVRQLGPTGGSASNPAGAITVVTYSTTILEPSSTRLYAAIQFDTVIGGGDGTVYLAFGGGASGTGIRIERGQRYEINQMNLWRGTVTGVSRTSSGGGSIKVGVAEWGL